MELPGYKDGEEGGRGGAGIGEQRTTASKYFLQKFTGMLRHKLQAISTPSRKLVPMKLKSPPSEMLHRVVSLKAIS